MAANGVSEHFSDERRERNAPRTRSGRSSPTHSAHGALIRSSLRKLSAEKKAKKIRFFRNGDRYFKGLGYAISSERFRTYEALLEDLTRAMVDKVSLPNGVRYIFTLDGIKITSLGDLEEGESYVCASTDAFRKINYNKIEVPQWNFGVIKHEQDLSVLKMDLVNSDGPKDFIRPKLITIIRNGIKPRKAVRMLLNKKTAHSFEQVLNDMTEAIKLDTGAVRRIFSIDGKPITNLAGFFKEDDIFIAYGPEKFAHDDFDLDSDECKFLSQSKSIQKVRPHSARSPVPRRRGESPSGKASSFQSSGSDQGSGRFSQPSSPRTPRKAKGKLTSKLKIQNGHGDEPDFPSDISNKYDIGKIIGDGNFAVVRECIEKNTNKEFALKIINKSKCKGKEQMIESEVSILRKVKHPNIVLLIEEYDTRNELYLIMELVKGGDLFDAISSSTKYTERDASGMVYNLASALKYLHSLNIVHRDIKPENLLVCEHEDGSKSLKLGDFGLAVEVKEPLLTVCGTPTYVAPEILAETGYGLKVDIWAAGVITYILLCGFPPFVSQYNNQDELFDQILSGRYEFTSPYWDEISDSAKELITHMLQVDPKRRFTASQVLNHAWVSDDLALDRDMQLNVSRKLSMHFDTKPKPSLKAAGVALIASTALDKEDKFYFQTSRRQMENHSLADSLSPSAQSFSSQQDEIF